MTTEFPDDLRWLISETRRRMREVPIGRADLDAVEAAVATHAGHFELWVLRGDLIQLLGDPGPDPSLEEALASYRRAAELAPEQPEPQLEIGCYLDTIEDDPAAALPYLERAVELGGGRSAVKALARVRAQLEG